MKDRTETSPRFFAPFADIDQLSQMQNLINDAILIQTESSEFSVIFVRILLTGFRKSTCRQHKVTLGDVAANSGQRRVGKRMRLFNCQRTYDDLTIARQVRSGQRFGDFSAFAVVACRGKMSGALGIRASLTRARGRRQRWRRRPSHGSSNLDGACWGVRSSDRHWADGNGGAPQRFPVVM